MHITQSEGGMLKVHRDWHDPKIYRESTLFYHVARHLKTVYGLDVIRKDAAKDGNLTSEGNYYVTDRKRRFAWHFSEYQIAFAYERFNLGHPVYLPLQPLGDVPKLKAVA